MISCSFLSLRFKCLIFKLNILNASICNLWFHSWAKYLIFTDACNIAKLTDVLISCKLLICSYLIIIVQCLSPYIIESFSTTSLCTEFFSAGSFRINSIIKYIKIQCVQSFIYCHGPSAWATLLRVMVNPWHLDKDTQR